MKSISAKKLKEWIKEKKVILIDVREPSEYQAGHIEGARLLPSSITEPIHLTHEKGQSIVVYCRSGRRGSCVCDRFKRMKFKNDVWNLEGGIQAWEKEKYPVIKGEFQRLPLMRQVQIAAGILIFLAVAAGFIKHENFFYLAGFIGLGLTLAGITGWCGLGLIIEKMPWNQR